MVGSGPLPAASTRSEIDPANPGEALQMAHGFAGEGGAVVKQNVPESLYQQLLDEGSISVEKPPGWDVPQTVFQPGSYGPLNDLRSGSRYSFVP